MARKHKKDLLQKGSPSCPYSVGVLIANDITGNALLRIRHQGLGGVDGAVPMMVLGAVLYRHRDLYSGRLAAGIAGAFLFVLIYTWSTFRCSSCWTAPESVLPLPGS